MAEFIILTHLYLYTCIIIRLENMGKNATHNQESS